MPDEIAILDAGTQIQGWTRTGYAFQGLHDSPKPGITGLPLLHSTGSGRFALLRAWYRRVQCDRPEESELRARGPDVHADVPARRRRVSASTIQVYRVFSNRPDANHRYMIDKAVRDQMVAIGWLAEGDGPDLVVMCAPS